MAHGTCDYCGAGYDIPTPKSVPTWFAWWLCQACNAEADAKVNPGAGA